MPTLNNLTKAQKTLATIVGILVALGSIATYSAKVLGIDANDFHIATSNDINKAHLRIAQQSQYTYEKELERLEERRMQNWNYQFQLEQNQQAIPPQLKDQELKTNEEIERLKNNLEDLDSEINLRQA